MKSDRIDFISAYCDRWCERCAFTMRCSTFACHAATAMCDGDFRQGLELAVGQPQPVDGARPEPPPWLQELLDYEPSAVEIAKAVEDDRLRNERIAAMKLSEASHDYTMASFRWLRDRTDSIRAGADATLSEALEVASFDTALIGAKIHRALHGRETFADGEDPDDHPVQNDWNGSAKVALISIERSEAAWRLIAQALADEGAAVLGELLHELADLVRQEFPDAMAFVRPGFDEPWRDS